MPNFLFKFNLLQVNEQVFHIFRIPVLKLLSYECKKITFLGGSYLEYYDECGNKIGWSIGIGGKGLGFSNTKGKVTGFQGALQ